VDPETWLILLVLVLVLVVPFAVLLRRANELFVLRVTGGKVTVERGRVPPSLLRDARDVLGDVAEATITARLENHLPMVRAEGLDEPHLQRMRNVVGRFKKAQLKAR